MSHIIRLKAQSPRSLFFIHKNQLGKIEPWEMGHLIQPTPDGDQPDPTLIQCDQTVNVTQSV